ncbi:hypothetical protein WMY93_006822 [Mugilogobius chulae]|uniref:ESF1 RRM domain-containing protein n=1 Tax=Mugilogobius chulae TaxID=88201 RepID=A0AAW0PLC7_9GOBI
MMCVLPFALWFVPLRSPYRLSARGTVGKPLGVRMSSQKQKHKQQQSDVDDRFSRVQRDPRFWEMPEKQRKVKIDKRFQSMFHDDRFKVKQTVDKRGRAIQHSTKEDLKKFYQLSDSDQEEEEEEEEETKAGLKPDRTKAGPSAEDEDDEDESEEDEESDEDEEDSDSDSDSGPDLARGKGNVETSSDEDSEDDVEEILRREEEEIQHDWGDLCKDAPRTEQVSRRLAVCNMDWDRIKAKDLLALFQSFCPKGGAVLSVKIFLSEFGKERLQQEQNQAPLELRTLPEDSEDDTEEEKSYRERMRQYQFRRLKYHYAVLECDRPETAAQIYSECDGFEYESSGSVLDLRFIPDDVQFDEKPKDVSTDVNLTSYSPNLFTSTSSSTSKVQLTWDETDHERVTALNRKFNKDELLNMDFKLTWPPPAKKKKKKRKGRGLWRKRRSLWRKGRSLQTKGRSHSRKQKTNTHNSEDPSLEKIPKKVKRSEQQIHKYRELLQGIRAKEEQSREREGGMEVTWVPGLKQNAEQKLKKRLESEKLGPWEQFLQKKKEKKKEKRKEKKSQDSEVGLSDDEIPSDVDLNDSFFKDELSAADVKNLKKKEKKKKRTRASDAEEEKNEEEEKRERVRDMGEDREEEKRERRTERGGGENEKDKRRRRRERVGERRRRDEEKRGRRRESRRKRKEGRRIERWRNKGRGRRGERRRKEGEGRRGKGKRRGGKRETRGEEEERERTRKKGGGQREKRRNEGGKKRGGGQRCKKE